MPNRLKSWLSVVALALAGPLQAAEPTADPAAEPTAEQVEFFEAKVRPILISRCFECHGNGQTKGGLSLESRDDFQKGADTGPVIDTDSLADSTLLLAVRHEEGLQMPPKSKLPDNEIAVLQKWVEQGAHWPVLHVKVPLGNLFDDTAEMSLGDALDSDEFQAAADATDLGVDRVLQGWGPEAEIASGIRFDFRAVGSGTESYSLVMNDAWGEQGGIRTQGQSFSSAGARTEQGIGMHANALITFDLTEIRKAGNLSPTQPFTFIADRAGLNDDVRGSNGRVHLVAIVSRTTGPADGKVMSVVVNGQPVEATWQDERFVITGTLPEPLTASSMFSPFNIPLPAEAQYLTLVAAGAGVAGDENPISSDHAVFSGARLEFEAPTVTVAQLGRAAPLGEYVITPEQRGFWSFQPIINHAPPAVQNPGWIRQPLDAFILHQLEQRGLRPVAPADRITFLRRVTFDLIGLPPTPAEIQTYLTDDSPQADEQLVERLLASPHYGERWGRYWLDVARYAEDQAHTFQARNYPNGYRYRDWVVDALNRDLPYDRFVTAQIAGDLEPVTPADATRDPLADLPALGYFALGPVYYSDAGCAAKAAADELDDRVDTLARGLLGLTVACARCHDHKFDPIPQRDYYSLAGIFSSTSYKLAPLVPQPVVDAYNAAQQRIKDQEELIQTFVSEQTPELEESIARQSAKLLLALWQLRHPVEGQSQSSKQSPKQSLEELARTQQIPVWLLERWRRYLRSENPEQSPELNDWRALPKPGDTVSYDEALQAAQRVADAYQMLVVAACVARKEARQQHADRVASTPEADRSKVEPFKFEGEQGALLQRLTQEDRGPLYIPRDKAADLLTGASSERMQELKTELTARQQASPPRYPEAHSLTEGNPGNMHIYVRGNHLKPGPEAPRQFLSILTAAEPTPFVEGSGRRELARAIVHPDNPLTARVIVNRIWQQHFGRGIVGTPSNFGKLGEAPSHPELLDFLAFRFREQGWSIKQLHREIVLSATYRLSSTNDLQNAEIDADNRYLWRMNRRRLDVEAWRDALLSVSGALDPTVGGPSQNLAAGDNRRRTLYGSISRHNLNPLLRLFDFPDPNITSERRTQTTVPLQQLFVLNSEFVVNQAQALTQRLQKMELPDDGERIRQAYLLLYGRPVTADELALGQAFLASEPQNGDASQLGVWPQYLQVLLAANEFTYVD